MTTFLGNPVTFTGKQLQVGDKALDFSLTTTDLSKKVLPTLKERKSLECCPIYRYRYLLNANTSLQPRTSQP